MGKAMSFAHTNPKRSHPPSGKAVGVLANLLEKQGYAAPNEARKVAWGFLELSSIKKMVEALTRLIVQKEGINPKEARHKAFSLFSQYLDFV
ncbi:MAG: hypothetical protein HY445_02070 [Candidatus Niyogibacteria bacterium]|nr:hypothetical protein [Candidatus Niyogibacteria bacterium]